MTCDETLAVFVFEAGTVVGLAGARFDPCRGRAERVGARAGWPVGETCVMRDAIACK